MDSASHSLSRYDFLSNFPEVIPTNMKIRPIYAAQETGRFQIGVDNRAYH
jgi:hypothetical protein